MNEYFIGAVGGLPLIAQNSSFSGDSKTDLITLIGQIVLLVLAFLGGKKAAGR